MAQFGYLLLLATMVVAVYTAAASVVGHHKKSQRLVVSSMYGAYGVFGLLTCASSVIIYLFVANDYSVKYVQHYSDRSMPLFYKITSFWGGQDGSLLFWVWVLSIWMAIAIYQNREKNRELMPYTIVAFMGVHLFFVVLMVFSANPFDTYLAGAPTDGRGLNPLLQNPYMVIHPPTLYLGYVGWAIPFCFAMGALAHNKLDYSWIAAMRRWCLVAWCCLGIGLALGGLWAYEELGWGGYWAWDPVENAAFFPWLTGTAFIHSIQVQERRGIFRIWNIVLITITFILTLFGTMLTRSGLVQSVHAFAQSDLGTYFLWFIAIVIIVSTVLVLYRARELEPSVGLESVLSREFAFLLNNWVLLAAAFLVFFATIFPSIFKAITEREVNVGPGFYNKWMIPIGLILLFLTGVGPLLSWRKSTGTTIRQQFTVPTIVAGISGLILFYGLEVTTWKPLTTFILCTFVTATIVQEFQRGTRHRMKNSGENVLDAFVTLIARARRRYGGYIVHFGIVLWFVGFAGDAYQLSEDKTMKQGEVTSIGRFDVRFDKMVFEDDGQKNMVTAYVSVFNRGTDEMIGTLKPAKWVYRKPEETTTTEVDKLMSFRDDLYLVLGAYDPEAGTVVLQMKVNPLVNYVWLGSAFLLFGFAVCVWPERKKVRKAVTVRRFATAAAGTATLLFSMVALILAFL